MFHGYVSHNQRVCGYSQYLYVIIKSCPADGSAKNQIQLSEAKIVDICSEQFLSLTTI